ncbi:MAG: hypothetical protein FJZ86_08920, partial [Chloroflexi bacterium]|nr:hypothetical protein [Chloroflexota bacterium]
MRNKVNLTQKTISYTFVGLLIVVFLSSIALPSQSGESVAAMNALDAGDTDTPTVTLENTPTPTTTFTPTVTPTFIGGVLTCNTVAAGVTCTNYGTYLDYNINIIVTGL